MVGTARNTTDKAVHAVLLLPVEVMRVWSDQLPSVEANYLADASYNGQSSIGTGNDDKRYIFMGVSQTNNNDGKGHIKVQVAIPGGDTIRNKILWRLAKTDGSGNLTISAGTSSYANLDADTQVVSITIDKPDDDDTGSDYILVGGYDLDGNGQLSSTEANIIPNCLYKGQRLPFAIKVVSQTCYNNAVNGITSYANGWIASALPHARCLLNAFASGNHPDESTSSAVTTIDRLEPGLDHPVGILFDSGKSSNNGLGKAGPGTSYIAIFAPQTQMASDVANSTTMKNWLQTKLSSSNNCAYVKQYFISHPNDDYAELSFDVSTVDASGKEKGLDFNFTTDIDLWFAFGKVNVTAVASVGVDRGFNVRDISITGNVNDLYDFNFDGSPAQLVKPAASVQAGFNTIGKAGQVFRSRVDMQDAAITDFQFQFPNQ